MTIEIRVTASPIAANISRRIALIISLFGDIRCIESCRLDIRSEGSRRKYSSPTLAFPRIQLPRQRIIRKEHAQHQCNACLGFEKLALALRRGLAQRAVVALPDRIVVWCLGTHGDPAGR